MTLEELNRSVHKNYTENDTVYRHTKIKDGGWATEKVKISEVMKNPNPKNAVYVQVMHFTQNHETSAH